MHALIWECCHSARFPDVPRTKAFEDHLRFGYSKIEMWNQTREMCAAEEVWQIQEQSLELTCEVSS